MNILNNWIIYVISYLFMATIFTQFYKITTKTLKIESILSYDIIYGLGGNPNHLIELCNNLPLREYMTKFLKKGIYIGESAGTIILCDDLKWLYVIKKGSKPKYDVEFDSYKGLNLSNTKAMPHYNRISESIKNKMDLYEKENNIIITKLNDGDFILEYFNN